MQKFVFFNKWKKWKGTFEFEFEFEFYQEKAENTESPSMQKNLKRCKARQKTQKVKIFVAIIGHFHEICCKYGA